MDFLFYTYLAFFFGIFPLSASLLFDKYRQFFSRGRMLIAIVLCSLLSRIITNGITYLRYLLDPMSLQGPEGVLLCFLAGFIYG